MGAGQAAIASGADYPVKRESLWDLSSSHAWTVICKVQGGGWQPLAGHPVGASLAAVHIGPRGLSLYERAAPAEQRHALLPDWEVWGRAEARRSSQLMRSHTRPDVRAAVERESVAKYYAQLRAYHPQIAMTLGHCWEEYVIGGLERWLFFLAYDGSEAPAEVSQYFCNQVLAFVKDHDITAATVRVPHV
jgi:hypothetical protein